MLIKPKAYSYLRFSTAQQMEGDSFRRQTALAVDYAKANDLELDEDLRFQDLGISAYRGNNAKVGALSLFLRAVEDGMIAPQSYLLVESLDRISRDQVLAAQATFLQIVNNDITVVTLADGRMYSKESLNANPTDLIISILVMMRAHEESATKARRVKAAWVGKRLKAVESKEPLTALTPAWINLMNHSETNKLYFEVDEEKAQVLRGIFKRIREGVGLETIAKDLNETGVKPFGVGQRWYRSYIQKLRDSPAVIGTMIPHHVEHTANGKSRVPLEPILNYFPAVIDVETFTEVQAVAKGRNPKTKSAHGVRSVLAGLARCPICDGTMTRITKGSAKKAGHPYLICASAKQGGGCKYKAVRLAPLEQAIIDNFEQIAADPPYTDQDHQKEYEDLQTLTFYLSDEIEATVKAISQKRLTSLLNELESLENQLEQAQKRMKELRETSATNSFAMVLNRASRLKQALEDTPEDIAQINQYLRAIFSKVVIDYENEAMHFYWQQGGTSMTSYSWTVEPTEGSFLG